MTWYSTGTIAVTNGGTTITGTGANWIDQGVGWWMWIDGEAAPVEIAAVVSSTEITARNPIQRATASGLSYLIIPTQGLTLSLREQIAELITTVQNTKSSWDAVVADFSATAYQLWLDEGNTGTAADFLADLQGDKGWSPVLATVTDGERRVHQVADWTGGEGTMPATGQFIGPTGLVATAAQAVNIRGAVGNGVASEAWDAQTGILTLTYDDETTAQIDFSGFLTAAVAARDKAEQWAKEVEDTEVETGQYSALHHAAKAAASAGAGATSATSAGNSATAAAASAAEAAGYVAAVPMNAAYLGDAFATQPLFKRASYYCDDLNQVYARGDRSGLRTAVEWDALDDFLRASVKYTPEPSGLLTEKAVNVRAFSYDWLTGQAQGLSSEFEQTNLLTYSEQFDNAAWGKTSDISVDANATAAPDGTLTADRIVTSASTGFRYVNRVSVTAVSGKATSYCYVKPDASSDFAIAVYGDALTKGARSQFNTTNLTSASAVIGGVTLADVNAVIFRRFDGWYFAAVTVDFSGVGGVSDVRLLLYPGVVASQNNDSIFAWGAQLVTGPYAGSYTPTDDAPGIRAADLLKVKPAVVADVVSATEGTVVVHLDLLASNSGIIWHLSDGTTNNDIRLYLTGNGNIGLRIRSGGVDQADFIISPAGVIAPANDVTIAASWSADGAFGCVNGGTVQSDLSITVPSGLDDIRWGHLVGGAGGCAAHFKKRVLFPDKLLGAELQAITS